MSETPASIVNVKALLGERFSGLLYFMEEGDVVLAKSKQPLSMQTLEGLRRCVEEIGERYVYVNSGFEIPKAATKLTPEVTVPPVVEAVPIDREFRNLRGSKFQIERSIRER